MNACPTKDRGSPCVWSLLAMQTLVGRTAPRSGTGMQIHCKRHNGWQNSRGMFECRAKVDSLVITDLQLSYKRDSKRSSAKAFWSDSSTHGKLDV